MSEQTEIKPTPAGARGVIEVSLALVCALTGCGGAGTIAGSGGGPTLSARSVAVSVSPAVAAQGLPVELRAMVTGSSSVSPIPGGTVAW